MSYTPNRRNRGTPTHFPCGHERSTANSLPRRKNRLAECRACARLRDRKRHLEKFKCGHPKSPENSVPSGSNSRTCRTCKAQRDHQYNIAKYQARKAREASESRRRPYPVTPAIALYRSEKDKRRQQALIAEARVAYDALLERERERTKGGRPKKAAQFQLPSKPGKPQVDARRVADADALLEALPAYFGRSA